MPTDTERLDWLQINAQRMGVVWNWRGNELRFKDRRDREWSDLRTAIDRGMEQDREKGLDSGGRSG